MNNIKYASTIKRDMVIIGCHWRWDVATKSRVVEYILANGIDAREGSIKSKYEGIAKEFDVSWNSVYNWVKQYRYTYDTTKKTSRGTVIYSPLIVKRGEETVTLKALRKLHKKLAKLRRAVEHAPGATVDAETIRKTVQPVQEELSEASIKSEK